MVSNLAGIVCAGARPPIVRERLAIILFPQLMWFILTKGGM